MGDVPAVLEPKWGIARNRSFFDRGDYEDLTLHYQRKFLEENLLIELLRDVVRELRMDFTHLKGQFRVIELLAGAGRVLRAIRDMLFGDDLVSAFLGRECGAEQFEDNITLVDKVYRGDDLLSVTPRLPHDMTFLVHVLYLFREELWPKVFERALGWTKKGGLAFVVMRNDRSTGSVILERLGAPKFGELNHFIETVTAGGRVELLDRREVGFSRLLDEDARAKLIRYWILDRDASQFPDGKVPDWSTLDQLVAELPPKFFANQELLIFRNIR